MFTDEALLSLLTKIGLKKTYWIAYSGGLDSHVLLYAFSQIRNQDHQIPIKAIHVNHGLSPKANDWEQHCQQVCNKLNVPIETITVDARHKPHQSPEAAARYVRYRLFADLLQDNDVLVTAHHQDDQAETLLLQLFRGAGPKGLAAMPEKKVLGKGILLRPFLGYSRSQLHDYAILHNLQWIDDESNFDTSIDRNYIRHQIMPLIKQRWKGVSETLARSASLCAQSASLLDVLATIDYQDCMGSKTHTLSIAKLLVLEPHRQNNIIRYWLSDTGLSLPNQRKLEQIHHDMLPCRQDAAPLLTWKGGEIRRYRDDLYAMQPLVKPQKIEPLLWELSITARIKLPSGLGYLVAEKKIGAGITIPQKQKITIRFRQGGEACKPAGRKETHSLKKLFQEWGIPPWERERIPLIYCDEQLAAIIGFCICEGFQVSEKEFGWEIQYF